jgi:8-oxo-dGTP pyrophosphatase MutT (NUDIX family)
MPVAVKSASVALLEGSRVLLIRRAQPPFDGLWTLPGGRLERGETAQAAAIREIGEELGLSISGLREVTRLTVADGLSGSIPPPRRFDLSVFATRSFAGDISPSHEIAGYLWVEADRAGNLPLTPHLREVIAAALAVFGHG